MEINPNMMSITAAQMQARAEAAQSQQVLSQAQVDAGRASKAVQGAAGGTDAAKQAALQKLTKVSQDFESLFLQYMLKTMRDTVPKDGLLDSGPAQEIFTSMHDEAISKDMAKAGGIGLGKVIVDQLKKTL